MVLNENIIRNIVSESLSSLILELDMGRIGGAGHLTENELIDPSVEFREDARLCMQIKAKKKANPNFRANLDKIFANSELYKIWQNYRNAMMSREGKKANGFLTFVKFVCGGKMGQKIMAYRENDNYLFGFWIRNHFIAAYFAPANPMGMYRLIKGIAQYDNVVFAVTQDLSPMLIKAGIPKSDTTHDAPWRGKMVTKDVFGTSQEAIAFGMRTLDFMTAIKTISK